FTDTHGVVTSTLNDLPGYKVITVLGTIYGLSARSRNIGAEVFAALKSTIGGELKLLTTLLYTSRGQAIERIVGECITRSGNAIIALRLDMNELMNIAQVCAHETPCVAQIKEPLGLGIAFEPFYSLLGPRVI
ncbi:UPF0145 domain protein, partial [Lojkania enalia]